MRRTGAVALAFVLVAACGSDDDEGGGTTAPATDASAATDAPATTEAPGPEPTAAPEPTDPPATDPQATDPPPTDPPQTTTTTETPQVVNAVGLVPLPGAQLDFTAALEPDQSLVWSLYSGSGGIIVENIGGPLPPGCHGTSFFDPDTFELLQIDGKDLEAYATRGDGGCGGMQQEVEPGVVDGDAVEIDTDEVIVFDFGGLPAPPFDVSTQVLDPDGRNGVFRSADPLDPLPVNPLGDPDLTHVIGADVLFELVDGALDPIAEPPAPPGDCSEFVLCLSDRFGIDIVDIAGTPGLVLVSGERSGLFTFLDEDEWQALVRVVNGCQFNDHFWVFAAATTDVEYELTVTDTVNGESRTYTSSLGTALEPVLDIAAFATCP